jgi:hypothetical protein
VPPFAWLLAATATLILGVGLGLAQLSGDASIPKS